MSHLSASVVQLEEQLGQVAVAHQAALDLRSVLEEAAAKQKLRVEALEEELTAAHSAVGESRDAAAALEEQLGGLAAAQQQNDACAQESLRAKEEAIQALTAQAELLGEEKAALHADHAALSVEVEAMRGQVTQLEARIQAEDCHHDEAQSELL